MHHRQSTARKSRPAAPFIRTAALVLIAAALAACEDPTTTTPNPATPTQPSEPAEPQPTPTLPVRLGACYPCADRSFGIGVPIRTITMPEASRGTAPLKYTLAPLPNGLKFDAATRTLSGAPTAQAIGTTTTTYTVTDSNGTSDSTSFDITVYRPVYWTDEGKIMRARLDRTKQSATTVIDQGLKNPRGIAIHKDGNSYKMYWTDSGTKKIQRANLDGSDIEDLVTTDLSRPFGIVIYQDKIYWADQGSNKIKRADLNGSNVETLISYRCSGCIGGGNPTGIVAHKDKLYWTDSWPYRIGSTTVYGSIRRSNLDGSDQAAIVPNENQTVYLHSPYSIAISNDTIRWTEPLNGFVDLRSANLDGSRVTSQKKEYGFKPIGIATHESTTCYTNRTFGDISCTGIGDIVEFGTIESYFPFGIAIVP